MGIAGITSALNSQFDFTKMTNSGLLNAAHQLGSEGKISAADEVRLVGVASGADSYPMNGNGPSVTDTLNDPTQKNFIDLLSQNLNSATGQGMTKQAALDQSLLTDMNQYQAIEIDNPGGNLSTRV